MKRQNDEKTVLVRQFGCLNPLDWDEECQTQLWLKNKMWNNLVETERKHREEYYNIVNQYSTVAKLEEKKQPLMERALEIKQEIKNIRKSARTLAKTETAALTTELKEINKKVKELNIKLKEKRAIARVKLKPHLVALEQQRREKVKEIRQNSGLWWGNYNDVVSRYDVARDRAIKTNAQLRFHSFDKSGTFVIQIQEKLTVDDLLNGKSNALKLTFMDQNEWQRQSGRKPSRVKQRAGSRRDKRVYGVLKFTLFTYKDENGKRQNRYLTLPVILERDLPIGDLKYAILKRTRYGEQFKWRVTFTFSVDKDKLPFPEGWKESKRTAGINLGWKMTKDGLRVATLVDDKGHVEHLNLPSKLLDRFDYIDEINSKLSTSCNEIFEYLKEKITELPEPLDEPWKKLLKAKTVAGFRLGYLLSMFEQHTKEFGQAFKRKSEREEILEKLKTWHEFYTKKRNHRDNLRRKCLGWRTNIYRIKSKEWAEKYGTLVFDDMDLSYLSKLEKPDGEKNELILLARRQRVLACVSQLREWAEKQGVKWRRKIEKVKAETTMVCHHCGEPVKQQTTIFWSCDHCKSIWDQDENASSNLVATHTGVHPKVMLKKLISENTLSR